MSAPPRVLTLPAGTAVWLGERLILVGCGDGLARDWAAAGLPAQGPDWVLFADGSPGNVAGLYALLAAAAAAGRRRALQLVTPLEDDRVAPLVGAFLQAETARFPIGIEAELPGAVLRLGSARLTLSHRPGGLRFTLVDSGHSLELHGPAT